MFNRWRQENFFKYLREEFALDALVDYGTEPADPDRLVPNPERKKLNAQLKAVRAEDQVKDTPFLMVTAEAQKENIIEAVKAKVSIYIIKPFTAETLAEKINKIFGG